MLLGIGVDLIEKERFAGWLQRPGMRRRFSAEEIKRAEASGRECEVLAAGFAAREAFYKAAAPLLTPQGGEPPRELFWQARLGHLRSGQPEILVAEPWRQRLREAGLAKICLTLTHDRTQALAIVVLTGEAQNGGDAERLLAELTPPDFKPLSLAEDAPIQVDMARVAAEGWLPLRKLDAHKGDFGHVLVVGGSARYTGAVQMAAEAALRGGAGLVTMAAPRGIEPLSPEIMRLRLPSAGGCLRTAAFSPIQSLLEGKQGYVLACGMGLGREAESLVLVRRLAEMPIPGVIDADGLFALAERGMVCGGQTVLTPHAGEMARLLGCSAAEVEADRLGAVRRCAAKYRAAAVLKGRRTLVCDTEGKVWENTTGNPGMACGGSGDVLAGLIAAWLAQGMPAARAAALAVFLHGLAGDLAAAAKSQYAMTAMDIVRFLPQAYLAVLSAQERESVGDVE